MTNDSTGHFEALKHTVFGGEQHKVPLYVKLREGLTNESNALLHAADIVGGNLHLFGGQVKNLAVVANYLVSDENDAPQEAVIISDSDGAGSISVDQQNTTVSIQGIGNWTIESNLFATMIQQWADYEDNER